MTPDSKKMRMRNRKQKRLFYVVQFIESPPEGIENSNYVCVPNSWLISSGNTYVTYPNNEDPSDTRDRVKRKEIPNDGWRFYKACKKYESDDYEDAENWIARKNHTDAGTQPEPHLNKKLRRAGQSFLSGPDSDRASTKAESKKISRKPLPRILIKRPLYPKPDKNLHNKRSKLNGNAKFGAVTDQTIVDSGCSNQKQSIINTDTEFIQNDQTKTSFALNDEINTEQSTQPEVIEKNQSVKMSINSTSTKLSAEQQFPPQPSAEQQPSPLGLDDQLSLSMSVMDLDESDVDIESCQYDLPEPVTEERLYTRTHPNILEQVSQPVNQKFTGLVRHEHSLQNTHPQDGFYEQTKKFNDSLKTHLHGILTAPMVELKAPSTINQHLQNFEQRQLPMIPVCSTLNSELRSAEFVGKKSIEVAGGHQTPCSQYCRDCIPSTSYHTPNGKMVLEPVAKVQSAAVKNPENPVDKKSRLIGNSKNITTMQYPISSMMQHSLPGNPAVTQTASPTLNHFRQSQVNGSLLNDMRFSKEETCINQKVPVFQVNTSAEQNFSQLQYQYRSVVGETREPQYVPTQADYLQQFAFIQDMLIRQNVASTIDQSVYHQNAMMSGGFVVPNPIKEPVQLFSQNENQYIPVNSAYAQKVIRHDMMSGPNGAHTTYKPNDQNGVIAQRADCYSSRQSHQNFVPPQEIQYPPIYRDLYTANTQNYLTLKLKHSSHMPKPQTITERPRSRSTSQSQSQAFLEIQRNCLLQEQGQGKMHPNSTKYWNTNLEVVPKNLMAEPAPSTEYAEVHTMTSSEIPNETQFTLIERNHTCQPPCINKTTVDKATKTDLMMDFDHCIKNIDGSPVGERASKLVDSACQTSEWLIEEQGSTYQETAKDQQEQSRIFAEQEILNSAGTLLTLTGATLFETCKMYNFLRNSMLVCTQEYETLLEKVDTLQTSPSNNVTSPPNNVIAGSSVGERASKLVDSTCEINEWLIEEQGSTYQETAKDQQEQSRIFAEQEILHSANTLLKRMGATLFKTYEMYNLFRNSMLVCKQEYETLLEKVDTFNSIETPTSSSNSVTSLPNNVIAGSSVGERASKLVYSACETSEWLIEEQGSTYQETAKDQQKQSRIFAEQELLNSAGTLLTQMKTTLFKICEMYNFFRYSMLVCTQEYETLLEKVDKFNSIETLQTPTPSCNNVTSLPNNVIAGSSVSKRTSKLVDSTCETSEWLIEEQGSTYQETTEDQQEQSRIFAEQEILDSVGTLLTQMGATLLKICEIYNFFRNSMLVCKQEYETLLEKDHTFNSIETPTSSSNNVTSPSNNVTSPYNNVTYLPNNVTSLPNNRTSPLNDLTFPPNNGTSPPNDLTFPPNNVTSLSNNVTSPPNIMTSQVLQVTQEKPARDNDKNTGVGDAVTPIRKQKGKFSLPAEYDPNDTKWTLKYRENKAGLVELIPRTGVYVSGKELTRCIRQSNNCRTLTRLLLTEIFSKNALSVCSLTGGRAKAFNSVNIDVRPGLDEDARMVLLAFVEEHGKKEGWVPFDTPAVMSTIRTKITEMRAKHGQF